MSTITGRPGPRSIIAGGITALHDDHIELGGTRIYTPAGMLTKGLIVGRSATAMVTQSSGKYIAERIELFSE